MKMEKLLPDTNSFEVNRVVSVLDKLIQFSLFVFAAFSMFSISVTQIAFALGALSWLLKVHLTNTWKELRGTLVGIAILCFCLACVLAVTASVDLESSFKHLKKLLQFIIFFWIANTVKDEKQRDLVVGLIIVAGVVAGLIVFSAYLDAGFIKPGWNQGTRSVPSTFSGALMIAGLMTLGRLLFHKPKEYWVLGSMGIIGLSLLLTLVRQAWLGFFVGSTFLVLFWNRKYLLLIPLLLAGLLLFAPQSIKMRMLSFTSLKDNTLQTRVSTWRGGWEIFKDHPIMGCGFKCADSVHSQYPDPSGAIARYRGMHNNVFQLLMDTGIVGLGTWLSIWATYFIEVFKRWRALNGEKPQDNAAGILLGTSAVVLAFLAGGFFETNIYDSEIAMLIYFLMGLSLAQVKKVSKVE